MSVLSSLLVRGLEQIGSALVARPDGLPEDPPADRVPVVLVGGLATTAPVLGPMAGYLAGLGHPVHPVAVGAGLDCGRRSVDVLVEKVREVAGESGGPVVLLGHSRGGQFARAAAVRTPRDVAGLITLGTPFDVLGLARPTMLVAVALAVAGSAGLGGLPGLSCLFGDCCREFRAALRGPWPSEVPFTSIYSADDQVVPPRASVEPAAHNVEVEGGHLALLTGLPARSAIADAVARSDREFAPAS